MAFDLGNLLGTLGSQYIQTRWGTSNGGYMPGGVMSSPTFLDVPFVDVVPDAGSAAQQHCSTKGLVYDPEKGKWIKRRRRRRRRLVTPTDLKDIAALKAIIGNGQALNSAVIKAVN